MEKILVVEDTQSIREEITEILQLEGFQVFEAIDGLEGIELAHKKVPNIIISDILMPNINGYQMLSELKKSVKTQNIPIIFLSAKAERSDFREGMNLGADDYLTKPLSPDDLIMAVNNKILKQELFQQKIEELKLNISRSLPHELGTPLHGIIGFSSILMDYSENTNNNQVKDIATSIHESSKKLQKVIKNYLLFTELLVKSKKSNKEKKKFSLINPKPIIIKSANKIGLKQNRLADISLNVTNCTIQIDAYELEIIIKELLCNAIKFSQAGERIDISCWSDDSVSYLTVRNEGIGMARENIDKIGGFMQFDREKIEQKGMGLGLSIIKLLTSEFNGTIEIDSEKGAYFFVKLGFPL